MAENKTPGYKKYLVYLKDAIYVIGIVIMLFGWMAEKNKSAAILETTVKNNTETLTKVEVFMQVQAGLNGQFIQYMAMDTHD